MTHTDKVLDLQEQRGDLAIKLSKLQDRYNDLYAESQINHFKAQSAELRINTKDELIKELRDTVEHLRKVQKGLIQGTK